MTTNKFSKGKAYSGKLPEAKAKVKQILSWSYSRFNKWYECPAAAKYKFLDKIEEPQGEAMARGERIHKLAEDYAKGKLKKLPEELKNFKEQFADLKKSKPICEEMWCFRSDWSETHDKDWDGIWLRVKTDAAVRDGSDVYVIDHKTGKNRGGYGDQMELSALVTFLKFPEAKRVITQLWFLDSGDIVEAEYMASDVARLKKKWEKKVAPMLADTSFHPKPSPSACKYCFYSKKKNGPCRF